MKIKTMISLTMVASCLIALFVPTSSQAMPATGSITGTTSYAGGFAVDHEVLVAAHPSPNSEPVAGVHTWGPGEYLMEDLSDGTYYISAFLDIHDRSEGPPIFGEPIGWYDANADGNPDPVTVSGDSSSGIDIAIADIDIDFIQGTACYLGGVDGPGQLEVALHLNPESSPVSSKTISGPCQEYIFSDEPAGSYYVSLFYDVNSSGGEPEAGEPFGWYDPDGDGSPDPVMYNNDMITDINITIGGIHYVDFSATGTADGSSWQDAFTDLQTALTAVNPGEEIWVAAGLYTPGTTRDSSFVLPHQVAVYGGFNGTEEYRHQRNWRANVTSLSGEIGDRTTKADNTYHVVKTAWTFDNPVDAATILDGFTITGGYADGDFNHTDKGGGLLNNYGTPTLVNLNFIDNYAINHGGALATQYNSEPLVIVNCTFSGNHATNNAGGIANLSKVTIINSSFTGNTGANGGGVVNLSGTHAEIYNTILWGNQGAEIALQGTATASVSYSIVEDGFANGSHISTSDPLFIDADGLDNLYGTLDDDLHLPSASPAVDAGDNTRVPADDADTNGNGDMRESIPLDMDRGQRFRDNPAITDTGNGTAPLIDIGADEFSTPEAITGLQIAAESATRLGQTTRIAARVLSGTNIRYTWDFGDGSSGDGPLPTHQYAAPGVYQVQLTATNSLGSQQTTMEVSVIETMIITPGSSQATGDGLLSIAIPPSITGNVTISYNPQPGPASAPGSYVFAGMAFQLQAADGAGSPIITPQEPFLLTIHYNQSNIPAGMDEATLKLFRYDDATSTLIPLPVISRNPDTDTFIVLLDHFSEFALFVELNEVDKTIYIPLIKR